MADISWMPSLPRAVDDDAASWGLSARLVVPLVAAPIVGGVLLAVLRTHAPTFRFLTEEDGPIEWLQVAFFLATTGAATRAALALRRAGEPVAALLFLGLALACVFIAGEEIAWGQRLLGIETPEKIARVNDQQETTIHNIGVLLYVFNVGMLAVAAYGASSPWLASRIGLPRWWRRWFVPPMALTTAFALPALFRIVRLTVVPHSTYTVTKWGEWTELCLAAALFAFSLLAARRVAADGGEGAATG